MSRILVVIGLVFIVIGLLWPIIKKLNIGRLPGDIIVKNENFTFYFPIVTCIVVSIILSLIFWFFNKK